MLVFLIIVSSVWALLHIYVANRLVGPLSVKTRVRRVLYGLFVPLAALTPSVFFADRLFTPAFALAYRWAVWTYTGAFSVLFALIVARDLLMLLLRGVDRLRARQAKPALLPTQPERRRFLLTATGGTAVAATTVLTGVGLRAARRVPEVVEVEVPIVGLPEALDGYHIVQLSDVHVGETIDKDYILPIVEAVTSLAPDLIALTGDLVDGSVDKLRVDISPFAYLRARDGVLCVTGNHEYYSGVDSWCAHFRELGMTVLNNEHTLVERKGARMLVAGVTDYREGRKVPGQASDPQKALAGAPAHDLRILLAHQPRSAFEATKLGYKLQLSGHTHGGQFFPWNLFVNMVEPLACGLDKVGDMWVYVSRGTCYWGPPLRTGVPAEITSLRLKRA